MVNDGERTPKYPKSKNCAVSLDSKKCVDLSLEERLHQAQQIRSQGKGWKCGSVVVELCRFRFHTRPSKSLAAVCQGMAGQGRHTLISEEVKFKLYCTCNSTEGDNKLKPLKPSVVSELNELHITPRVQPVSPQVMPCKFKWDLCPRPPNLRCW